MASRVPTTVHAGRRPHAALVLAILSALALALPVSANSLVPAPAGGAVEPPAAAVASAPASEAGPARPATALAAFTAANAADTSSVAPAAPSVASVASASKPAAKASPAASSAKPATTRPSRPAPAATRYAGRNHVWIPSLGISRSVSAFSCSRSAPPVNLVYRWGCAGAGNVYLFGHAYSVFKPLHDAYVGGRLRRGMKVVYADGSGRVHTYSVTWWRLTTPENGAFAYAAQSRPSMTLQTCVGSRSQYRLIVRLVQVG